MENNILETEAKTIKVNRQRMTVRESIYVNDKINVNRRRRNRIWLILFFVLFTPVALYYLWTRGLVYLNVSREVYTDYFWYRAPWLFVHVVCGLLATFIGAVQFIPTVRRTRPALHRGLGKTYVGCIVVSTCVSFYLVSTATLGLVYVTGLTCLGIVWLGCTLMAYFSIRKKNIEMHREWMIKSYVLTLAFVCFRSVEDVLALMNIGDFFSRKVLMAWACWAVPFFVTEVVLQARKIFRMPAALSN